MNRTIAFCAASALSLILAAAASAAGNPVEQRQALMKEVGQQMKAASAYVTGRTPWDTAGAHAAMEKIEANAKALKGLYPPGSDKDPKSEALPVIWENKGDFEKKLADMGKAAEAASKASDQASFKASFAPLVSTCSACHNTYRKKTT